MAVTSTTSTEQAAVIYASVSIRKKMNWKNEVHSTARAMHTTRDCDIVANY
jgi:hypothetical protein